MTRPGFLAVDRISHRGALVGRAIDQLAGTPLAGVTVAITSGPPAWTARVAALRQGQPIARPEVRVTAGDGVFRWLDLPAGAYALAATVPGIRYAAASASAAVSVTALATAELALAPTAVTGLVQAGAQPLAMARVRFADSGDTVYTGADGRFVLSPVEAGASRALEVSAQNYNLVIQPVTLLQGQTITAATITLTRS